VRNRNKGVLALGPIAFVLLKDMETTGVSMSFFLLEQRRLAHG
jgi:hypothetical protein